MPGNGQDSTTHDSVVVKEFSGGGEKVSAAPCCMGGGSVSNVVRSVGAVGVAPGSVPVSVISGWGMVAVRELVARGIPTRATVAEEPL